MDSFLNQVQEFIAARQLMPLGSPVIAGVSGGADSLSLLLILEHLRQPLKLELTVAHLNHGLRGDQADADQEFVRDWCRRLEISFVSRQTDVGGQACDAGISIEEAGRLARYSFFSELADQIDRENGRQPALIALAHHLDDQAETLLLHLGRGSGLDGLTGMKPQTGRLIRPLLGQSRQAIEAWLTSQGIVWRQDATNFEPVALRNRLRLQVLPLWREVLGYDPAPLLSRTAASLTEDQTLLDHLADQAAEKCRSGDGLLTAELLRLHPALQNRLLRQFWLERTGSSKNFSYTHIQQLRNWLPNSISGQQISLPGNWRAKIEGFLLLIVPSTELPFEYPASPVRLNLPGLTQIEQLKLQITAVLIENDCDIVYNNTTEYFQLDRIDGCVIRHRLPGDRIHPLGRNCGKNLKKFLNEQGIRPEDRDRLPLVACGQEIVWLPGFTAGQAFVRRPDDGLTGPLIRLEIIPWITEGGISSK